MREATFRADSPVGGWATIVPIADDEQRHEYAGRTGRFSLFLTTGLRIYPGWVSTPTEGGMRVKYWLSGPNIRVDGTPGVRTLTCEVTRERVEEAYPGALALAKEMLADGCNRILAQANAAVDEINTVIRGGGK